jgi:anti-sigma factor RsiW
MSATTCDPGLIEDYLEQQLDQGDRQRLEAHLALCPRCAEELRGQLDLEHRMRQALASSVQALCLSPEARARIVCAGQGNARRGVWIHHLASAGQVVASAAAVILLLAGLVFSLGYRSPEWADTLLRAILPPDLVAPDGAQSEKLSA